jgi:hypothetical protein
MIKLKWLLLLIAFGLVAVNLNACKFSEIKDKTSAIQKIKPAIDFEQYKGLKTYNVSMYYQTSNVINKANEIKKKLEEEKKLDIESFSVNDSSASLRASFPAGSTDKIINLLDDVSDLTNMNKNFNESGEYFISFAEKYYAFKALDDNFEYIIKVLKDNNTYYVDDFKLKEIIESSMKHNKGSMESYEKQLNKGYLQVSVSKTN